MVIPALITAIVAVNIGFALGYHTRRKEEQQ